MNGRGARIGAIVFGASAALVVVTTLGCGGGDDDEARADAGEEGGVDAALGDAETTATDANGDAESLDAGADACPREIAFLGRPRGEIGTDLYKSSLDGQPPRLLVEHRDADIEGIAWSPDSSTLAYTSDLEGQAELYVYDLDDDSETRLTDHSGSDVEDERPLWSPDGQTLLFVRSDDDGDALWRVDVDGEGEELVREPEAGFDVRRIVGNWSPDGERLAFAELAAEGLIDDGTMSIGVMNPDGSGSSILHAFDSAGLAAPGAVEWSPDGSRLAYTGGAGLDDDGVRLGVVKEDGTDHIVVAETAAVFGEAADMNWSPDGSTLVYGNCEVQPATLCTVPSSGGAKTTLREGHSPRFSLDGGRIAYVEGEDAFLMDPDAANSRRIEPGITTAHAEPTWRPCADASE